MLPFVERDVQQIERKSKLGNDIVVVVFEDFDEAAVRSGRATPFTADMVASHFNHVYVVVRAVKGSQHQFKVRDVLYKNCAALDEFGPTLPPVLDALVPEHHERFVAFLVNAERAAYQHETFAKKAERTQRALLNALVNQFVAPPGTPRQTK